MPNKIDSLRHRRVIPLIVLVFLFALCAFVMSSRPALAETGCWWIENDSGQTVTLTFFFPNGIVPINGRTSYVMPPKDRFQECFLRNGLWQEIAVTANAKFERGQWVATVGPPQSVLFVGDTIQAPPPGTYQIVPLNAVENESPKVHAAPGFPVDWWTSGWLHGNYRTCQIIGAPSDLPSSTECYDVVNENGDEVARLLRLGPSWNMSAGDCSLRDPRVALKPNGDARFASQVSTVRAIHGDIWHMDLDLFHGGTWVWNGRHDSSRFGDMSGWVDFNFSFNWREWAAKSGQPNQAVTGVIGFRVNNSKC